MCIFVFVGGNLIQALPFVYAFLSGKIDNNNNYGKEITGA